MQVNAKLNNLRVSPKKVRLVAGLVRGKEVNKALNELKFLNKKSALPILVLLKSAISNAEHNFKLSKDNLKILEITVDQGMTLKRYMPRAFGRASMIRKKMSKIEIILTEIVASKEGKTTKKAIVDTKEEKPLQMQSERPKEQIDLESDKKTIEVHKPAQRVEKKILNRTTNK